MGAGQGELSDLTVVAGFGFGWWDVADGGEQPAWRTSGQNLIHPDRMMTRHVRKRTISLMTTGPAGQTTASPVGACEER